LTSSGSPVALDQLQVSCAADRGHVRRHGRDPKAAPISTSTSSRRRAATRLALPMSGYMLWCVFSCVRILARTIAHLMRRQAEPADLEQSRRTSDAKPLRVQAFKVRASGGDASLFESGTTANRRR